MRQHRNLNQNGYTMTEIIVAILIIGILTAIAVPAWFSIRNNQWANEIKNDLQIVVLDAEKFRASNGGSTTGYTQQHVNHAHQTGNPNTTIVLIAAHQNTVILQATGHGQTWCQSTKSIVTKGEC